MGTDAPSVWTTAAPYVAAFLAGVAALTVAWISHSAKISEFRQTWINDLRKDTADFIGAAELWFRKWDEINDLQSGEKERREREELLPLANTARVVLWRIRLRINPRKNRNKAEDDKFLNSLAALLNPGKVEPSNMDASWLKLADKAVDQGREIMKREWEVTKPFPVFRWFLNCIRG